MGTNTHIRPVSEVERRCLMALSRAGVPEAHARTQLSLLLDAELKGVFSHGLLRLPRVIERVRNGVCDPCTTGHGTWRDSAFYQVDGANGLGPVVALDAIEQLIQRAGSTGVAVAAVRHCDHLGMLAWYAERVASQGLILIALTVSEALVHPWGGNRAMLGTNPIAIGVPARPHPFVLDMATSLVSMGKIHDYANRGRGLPAGWAVDAAGRPTVDAEAAKLGAIAPFGEAKGYGLGLGFELLVTALAGSAIGREVVGTLDSCKRCNKGDVFIVMKPMAGTADLINGYLEDLRASPAADPRHTVRVPGDRGRSSRAERAHDGIEIDPGVWARIEEMAGA